MIKYPNGKKYTPSKDKRKLTDIEVSFSSINRGMDFENDINISNEYYRDHKIALINKRATPINVVHVDYKNNGKITDAYFEKESTTDYNGIYKKKYIDFEAKNTISRTSFSLANIPQHQIDHLNEVKSFGGIAFLLINFQKLDKTFILLIEDFDNFAYCFERKSIPLAYFEEKGIPVEHGYRPRLYYLEALDSLINLEE